MGTLRGREAVRGLEDLFTRIRARGLLASEYHQNRQEVESCFGAGTLYVPRMRLTLNLNEATPAARVSVVAVDDLRRVLDLAKRGLLRNLHLDLDPCGDDACYGIRLSLWYDDESATTQAMCA